jgi:uncharacterized protein (TIGR02145 family)
MNKLLLPISLLLIAIISIGCDKDDGPTQPNTWTCGNTIDYEGKTYNTVQIGSQCWLKENLNVGTMIQGSDTSKNNGIIEKYCYNDSTANCDIYGGLYQWNEAMQYITTEGTQGICPSGWHIPTYTEFPILRTTVDSNANSLKAIGQGSGVGAGTNTSGFSALLAGYRYWGGFFYHLGYYAEFWSSAEIDYTRATSMYLNNDSSLIYLYYQGIKENGFSVRCIKD